MTRKFMKATEVLELWTSLPRCEQYSASARRYAKMAGLKSMLEVRSQAWFENRNIPFKYEGERWNYQYEPQTYRPDFNINEEWSIECKGKLTKEVRKKLLAIIKSNPNKKLFMVFEKPDNRINRGSKTTYADWANKHGIPWSDTVPDLKWFRRKKKDGSR